MIRIGSSINLREGTILHCAPDKEPTAPGRSMTKDEA